MRIFLFSKQSCQRVGLLHEDWKILKKKNLRIIIKVSISSLRSRELKLLSTKVGDLESSFDKIEFFPTFDRSYNFSSTVVFSFNYSQPLKYFSF